jgi:hypothetical protein
MVGIEVNRVSRIQVLLSVRKTLWCDLAYFVYAALRSSWFSSFPLVACQGDLHIISLIRTVFVIIFVGLSLGNLRGN